MEYDILRKSKFDCALCCETGNGEEIDGEAVVKALEGQSEQRAIFEGAVGINARWKP